MNKALSAKLQKVQNACIRFIFNLRKFDREHISPYIIKLGWLNMESRRNLHALTFMHKIDNDMAPDYISRLVPRNNNFHNYNTRAAGNFRNTRCNLSLRQNSFFGRIPSMFNNLPTAIKRSKTPFDFKLKCKAHLFSVQQEE